MKKLLSYSLVLISISSISASVSASAADLGRCSESAINPYSVQAGDICHLGEVTWKIVINDLNAHVFLDMKSNLTVSLTSGGSSWQDAMKYCQDGVDDMGRLPGGGYRLPSVDDFNILHMDGLSEFNSFWGEIFWTSTKASPGKAQLFRFDDIGDTWNMEKDANVACVKGP